MLQPIHDLVLVSLMEAEAKTSSGIIIPDTAKEKPQKGKVIAKGNEVAEINDGDIILFRKNAGAEVEFDNIKYVLMKSQDIWAIIE